MTNTTQNNIAAARGFIGWCSMMGMRREDAITAACRAMTSDRLPRIDGRTLQSIVAQAYDTPAMPTAYKRASFREVQHGLAF